MKRQYDPEFIKKLKQLDVRIRKSFRERIVIFAKNPYDPQLNNHELKDEYKGYRSIDITSDYRAIYRAIYEEIVKEGVEQIAYFIIIGTHEELYDSYLG